MKNDERVKKIEKHVEKMNEEFGVVQIDVATIKTDIKWIKKNQWFILTTSIGLMVTVLLIFANSIL